MKNLFLVLIVFQLHYARASVSTAKKVPDANNDSAASAAKGFKVMSIVPGSAFEKLNLIEGDVILSANGKNINSIEDAQVFYTESKVQDLYVRRNGKTIRIDK